MFQGEGGTLEGLLAHTASVTSTLADRDEVIGDLIDNLSLVLDHVADRDEQLTRLIRDRAAFGNECRPTGNGVAVPVPIAADQSEREVVTAMVPDSFQVARGEVGPVSRGTSTTTSCRW